MVSLSMTLSDPDPGFKDIVVLKANISKSTHFTDRLDNLPAAKQQYQTNKQRQSTESIYII